MPNGRTHDKVNDLLIVGAMTTFISFILYLIYGILGAVIGIGTILGYLFGTRYNGPDLDVESRLYYRWGILKFIWKPYQSIFSHRSIFTHGILIGDIIRYAYLILIGSIAYLFIEFIMQKLGIQNFLNTISLYETSKTSFVQFINDEKEMVNFFIASLFIGNVIASTVHIITDHTVTKAKRMFYKKKRRR